jgi:uncharacterized repeat protein (TIGR03803 family)
MESRVLLSSSGTPQYILNTIGYFGGNGGGGNPKSTLIADAQGNLYGTTTGGGQYAAGTVFEIANDALNKITTLVSFNGTDGSTPIAGLTMDATGDLFGTTYTGGTYNVGTVFEIAKGPYPVLTTLASFTGNTNTTTGFIGNGAHPAAGVTLDASGNLFGVADDGGDNRDGTVWEIATGSTTITVLASFAGGAAGARPNGNVLLDGADNIFGTAYANGANNDGTVFELPAGSNTISTLASFSGPDGNRPYGGLARDGAGDLYGTTFAGGANNKGAVFELPFGSDKLTALASFTGDDGASPYAGVIFDTSGNLYGTTELGGANNDGTAFEVAAGSGTITTLASFDVTNGSTPYGGLLLDSTGNLLGTSYLGGDNGAGTVFKIANGTNAITTIASFGGVGSSLEGFSEAVIVDDAGNVYGMTPYGGVFGDGTVYEIAAGTTTITTLASFNETDGAQPDGVLAIDSKGNLFGAASAGGDNGDGTVFEIAAGSNAITALASFNGTNGMTPNAGVIIDENGNLYGTTTYGGANSDGTVFEVGAGATSINTLASFDVTKDGANPYTGVTVDSSGNLYGTAVGGPNAAGIVYEVFRGSGAIAPLATFNADGNGQYPDGEYPDGGVIRDSAGNLYGTAYMGGADNYGTVFKVPAGSSAATAIASFTIDSDGTNHGQYPHSNLVMDSSGNLYGTTYEGGAKGLGTVFEVTTTSTTVTTLASFDGKNGEYPYVGMAMDASGNFYGTTEQGGPINGGTVFQLSTQSLVTLSPETDTPNPAQASQALHYVVSLADEVPDGETVTIEDTSNNNVVVATGTLTGDTAILTIPANTLADGTHNLVAVYAGDGTYPPGQSNPYAQVIEGAFAWPAWLATDSQASWDPTAHTLTVTGPSTIIADPGSDEPNIIASGSAAQLKVQLATSPTDVHVGGISLSNGAGMQVVSVGAGRTHANHNVLVVGTLGTANNPTFAIDATSKLDLSDNDLVLHVGSSDANGTAAYNSIYALAKSGRHGDPATPDGTWDGVGLDSSAATAVFNAQGYEQVALGVVDNNQLAFGSFSKWTVGSASESLGANDVIVKYTYVGDYALEGMVGGDNAGILQVEYDHGASNTHNWATGSSLWDGLADDNEAGVFQIQYGLGTGGKNGPQL